MATPRTTKPKPDRKHAPKPDLVPFGQVLLAERKRRAETQEVFAGRLGISRGPYADLERGTRNPTLTMLLRIATGLDMPLSALMLRTEREALKPAAHSAESSSPARSPR